VTTYAYIRVSTDRQDLDNQRHGVIEYARKHGLEPLHFFEDTVSGTKDWQEREIGRLLRRAKKGDVVLTAEFSRLGRSALQVMLVLEEAAKREVTIHIVKNGLVMDGSLNSRMMALAFGMAAEIERDFISKRTTEALAKRKAEGKPLGRPRGRTSEVKKLDKRKDEILDLLKKDVHKTSIARILECSPVTLYQWLEANGLGRYIKTRKGDKKRDVKAESATHGKGNDSPDNSGGGVVGVVGTGKRRRKS
jgi:DNA invertase Pin-like site-specific DNA recombinase